MCKSWDEEISLHLKQAFCPAGPRLVRPAQQPWVVQHHCKTEVHVNITQKWHRLFKQSESHGLQQRKSTCLMAVEFCCILMGRPEERRNLGLLRWAKWSIFSATCPAELGVAACLCATGLLTWTPLTAPDPALIERILMGQSYCDLFCSARVICPDSYSVEGGFPAVERQIERQSKNKYRTARSAV